VASVSFVPGDPSTNDAFGHGTHIAGIIAGQKTSVTPLYDGGIAPGAHLINVRVLGNEGSGYTSDVMAGIQWTVANKDKYAIRVMNLSLGHPRLVDLPSLGDDPTQITEVSLDLWAARVAENRPCNAAATGAHSNCPFGTCVPRTPAEGPERQLRYGLPGSCLHFIVGKIGSSSVHPCTSRLAMPGA